MRVWSVIIATLMAIVVGVSGTAAGSLGFYVPGDINFPIVKLIINGEPKAPDVPAMVIDGRTMVPLRFIAETFGATVNWDPETYTVSVEFKKPSAPPDVSASSVVVTPVTSTGTAAPGTPVTVTPVTVTPVITQTPTTPVTVVPVTPVSPGTPVTVVPVTPTAPGTSATQGPTFGPPNRKEPQIEGSAYFQQIEAQALNLLLAKDLEGYMLVCSHLTKIRESEHTGVNLSTGVFNHRLANYSPNELVAWEAASLVHEATHVWLTTKNYQATGEKAESFCNRAMVESLIKVGAPSWMIEGVRSSISTQYWEVPYEQRNW